MKKWFVYIVYLSILFLVIALIRGDYLILPRILSIPEFIVCIFLLFAGFVFDSSAWWKSLNVAKIKEATFIMAITGHGLSILGKYIPGKFWIVLGRASYTAKFTEKDKKRLPMLSLNAQIISIWTSFLFGLIVFLFIPAGSYYTITLIAAIIWIILFLVLFTDFFHRIAGRFLKYILKKEIIIPRLSIRETLKIIPWYIATWFCWCSSFYFLASSMLEYPIIPYSGLTFALAATMGLIVLISPGGLGVREGILAGILILWDISTSDATTIAVVARLWFLIGEIFIFLVGYFCLRFHKT